MVNRLRDVLMGRFPAQDSTFDFADSRGAVVLLTGCHTRPPGRPASGTATRRWTQATTGQMR